MNSLTKTRARPKPELIEPVATLCFEPFFNAKSKVPQKTNGSGGERGRKVPFLVKHYFISYMYDLIIQLLKIGEKQIREERLAIHLEMKEFYEYLQWGRIHLLSYF